jgi:hypothetical protein
MFGQNSPPKVEEKKTGWEKRLTGSFGETTL